MLSRSQVRELDRLAIEERGVPSALLMENAARACADAIANLQPRGLVVVLCGPGNNGGDGFAIARTLHNRGYEVQLFLSTKLSVLERASADVRLHAQLWRDLGQPVGELGPNPELKSWLLALSRCCLVVDALFGTGLARPLDDFHLNLLSGVRASGQPVFAVDLPSGLDADSGQVLGDALAAICTVTFVAHKPGLLCGEGPRLAGRIQVAEIGIPIDLIRGTRFGAS